MVAIEAETVLPHRLATTPLSAPAEPRRALPARIELPIVQMLCSRLCHDLAGPAGAVGAGIDLLGEAAGSDPEALELVAFGARQLAARLNYYRVAFGFGGSAANLSWPGVRALTDSLFENSRVSAEWAEPMPAADDDPSPDIFRLALLLLLLGAEALPRGGKLCLAATPARPGWTLSVRATGPVAALGTETRAALFGGEDCPITSRTVTAFYAARLADALGATIDEHGGDGTFELHAALPATSAAL